MRRVQLAEELREELGEARGVGDVGQERAVVGDEGRPVDAVQPGLVELRRHLTDDVVVHRRARRGTAPADLRGERNGLGVDLAALRLGAHRFADVVGRELAVVREHERGRAVLRERERARSLVAERREPVRRVVPRPVRVEPPRLALLREREDGLAVATHGVADERGALRGQAHRALLEQLGLERDDRDRLVGVGTAALALAAPRLRRAALAVRIVLRVVPRLRVVLRRRGGRARARRLRCRRLLRLLFVGEQVLELLRRQAEAVAGGAGQQHAHDVFLAPPRPMATRPEPVRDEREHATVATPPRRVFLVSAARDVDGRPAAGGDHDDRGDPAARVERGGGEMAAVGRPREPHVAVGVGEVAGGRQQRADVARGERQHGHLVAVAHEGEELAVGRRDRVELLRGGREDDRLRDEGRARQPLLARAGRGRGVQVPRPVAFAREVEAFAVGLPRDHPLLRGRVGDALRGAVFHGRDVDVAAHDERDLFPVGRRRHLRRLVREDEPPLVVHAGGRGRVDDDAARGSARRTHPQRAVVGVRERAVPRQRQRPHRVDGMVGHLRGGRVGREVGRVDVERPPALGEEPEAPVGAHPSVAVLGARAGREPRVARRGEVVAPEIARRGRRVMFAERVLERLQVLVDDRPPVRRVPRREGGRRHHEGRARAVEGRRPELGPPTRRHAPRVVAPASAEEDGGAVGREPGRALVGRVEREAAFGAAVGGDDEDVEVAVAVGREGDRPSVGRPHGRRLHAFVGRERHGPPARDGHRPHVAAVGEREPRGVRRDRRIPQPARLVGVRGSREHGAGDEQGREQPRRHEDDDLSAHDALPGAPRPRGGARAGGGYPDPPAPLNGAWSRGRPGARSRSGSAGSTCRRGP